MSRWLVKTEPTTYSWTRFVAEGGTVWDGVRNYQARNHLIAMKRDDPVLFYHSIGEKAVVGIARVRREAYPDPTTSDPRWIAVDLEPVEPLTRPVTLAQIKQTPALRNVALVRQSRLSVMALTANEYRAILALGRGAVAKSVTKTSGGTARATNPTGRRTEKTSNAPKARSRASKRPRRKG